jgi:Fic family protein
MQPFVPELLPIENVDWPSLIPVLSKANRAISRYDGIIHSVPNPDLLLSPLTTQEAILSSKIEGTQATLGEVFKFEVGENQLQESRKDDFQEIINYRRALFEAQEELRSRPFNLNLLLHLHSVLLDSVRGRNMGRGQFRTTQNWIGAPNSTIEHADFVPPVPLLLTQYLDNWEKYYHSDCPDALVQMALVHAQFEIIHPFSDGNGRLGRLIIPLFLFEKKLLPRPIFYLSDWLEEHREGYVSHLRELGRNQDSWNRWIHFFLTGLAEQAEKNSITALAIKSHYETLKTKVIQQTHSQFAVPLLDQIFARPIFTSSDLVFSEPTPSRPAVNNLLKALRETKLITCLREGSGRRPAIYVQSELMNICEGRQIF